MPMESGERRPSRLQNAVGPVPGPGPQPQQPPKAAEEQQPPKAAEEQQLACPRCRSTNTKFCYYNNYNLSQPRHFCKSCRRYWTQGGTLRNVPIGGGTRKNSKRSRSTSSCNVSSASSSSSSTAASSLTHESESLPVSLPPGNPDSAPPLANIKADPMYDDLNLNENLPDGAFLSLMMSSQSAQQGAGGSMGLGVNGYGPSGFGFGLCEPPGLGFGGRGIWAYPGMGYNYTAGSAVGNGGVVGSSSSNTWQLDDVDGGELVDGDCFAWPSLAIPNHPGRSLK